MCDAAVIDLKAVRDKITGQMALLHKYEADYAGVQAKLQNAKHQQAVYAESTQLFRDLYEQTQERFHGQIMQIVSYCLREVFGDDSYEFKIIFEQKRNQVEARFVLCSNGQEYDPLSAVGGGVLDVCSFALRLAVIYLTRNTMRSIMILDEPFRYLSVEYRPKIAELLQKLSTEFNFQFIMVTHISELEIGLVHRIA